MEQYLIHIHAQQRIAAQQVQNENPHLLTYWNSSGKHHLGKLGLLLLACHDLLDVILKR